jgi:AcrR family transcriptional regulator
MTAPPVRFRRQTAGERRQSLIEAAIRCLSRGGIAGFTVDAISSEAGVSRGLINHHFDGIEDLLAAVYAEMTSAMLAAGERALSAEGTAEQRLVSVLAALFEPPLFSRNTLRAWLALWGETAVNPRLRAAHRKSYDSYRKAMANVIGEIAAARHLTVDSSQLAIACIALVDGLWIEWCLDPSVISREAAQAAIYDVLEAKLGPLQR